MNRLKKRKIAVVSALLLFLMLAFSPVIISFSIYIQGTFTPTGEGQADTNITSVFIEGFGGKADITEFQELLTTDFEIPNGTTQVEIDTAYWNVTINHYKTFNWSIETAPNIGSASGNDETTGVKSCPLSGLQYNTIYTVFLNATGSQINQTYWFGTVAEPEVNMTNVYTLDFGGKAETLGNEPQISNPQPPDSETNVDLFPWLNITVADAQNFNITWIYYTSPPWVFGTPQVFAENISVASGTYRQRALWANQSETQYWWEVRVNDTDQNWAGNGTWYTFTIANYTWSEWSDYWKIVFAPDTFVAPTNFVATGYSNSAINLTWDKNLNATTTYIRASKTGYPNLTEGWEVYNGTDSAYNHTGLDPGTIYYYSAWTYNSTYEYSFNTAVDTGCTNPGNPSGLIVTDTAMESITLSWTKGTNATNTVIVMNETGYPGYPTNPTNGTEKYNDTASSYEIGGLTANSTYYFSVWSYTACGFSDSYVVINETTVATADSPSNLEATTLNHSAISLTWDKGADWTTIVRKIDSYPTSPTDGLVIYNGTAQSYTHTGLTPVEHYYYRAWGWNGESHSVGYTQDENVTLPEPPQDLRGGIDDDVLTIEWTKGEGAVTTVLRNDSSGYPTDPLGGDGSVLVYNDTGEIKTVSGVTDIDYYTGWSYAFKDGYHLYSNSQTILWGGLELNVFKQSNPTIAIENYTVFITNQQGTETFENVSSNPTRIDVEDVPNGEDIAIRISKAGYNPATIYTDLFENAWYSINFYLSPNVEGGGDAGDDDYIPPQDEPAGDNESYGELYLLTVLTVYDQPIENALMNIRLYINETDTYESVHSVFTDANGNVEVFLIPGYFYKITITKDGYVTEYSDYTPSDSILTRTFRMLYDVDEDDVEGGLWDGIAWDIYPTTVYHDSNISMYFNISSQYGQLEWFDMTVSRYYTNNDTWVTIDYQNSSNAYGGQLNYTTINESGQYGLTCRFKKQNFSIYTFDAGDGICRKFFITYQTLTQELDTIPEVIYIIFAIFLAIASMGLLIKMGAGELSGYVGLTVMTIIFALRPDTVHFGGFAWYWVMLVTGIIYTVILFLSGRLRI